MRLSIVTVCYNDPRVGSALESVQSQRSDSQVEYIVVDGDSDPPIPSILEDHRDAIDVLISEPDEGVYDAMNKGIQAATGDVVGILNSDDRYQDEEVLQDVVDAFRDPEVDACYGDLVYVDDADRPRRLWRSGSPARWKWRAGWMPPHPTFFVRRSAYEDHGLFDLDFPISADYELMLRFLVCQDLTARYIPRILVRMSLGGQSNESLGNIVQGNREVARAWEKNCLSGGRVPAVLKPGRKVLQYPRALVHRLRTRTASPSP